MGRTSVQKVSCDATGRNVVRARGAVSGSLPAAVRDRVLVLGCGVIHTITHKTGAKGPKRKSKKKQLKKATEVAKEREAAIKVFEKQRPREDEVLAELIERTGSRYEAEAMFKDEMGTRLAKYRLGLQELTAEFNTMSDDEKEADDADAATEAAEALGKDTAAPVEADSYTITDMTLRSKAEFARVLHAWHPNCCKGVDIDDWSVLAGVVTQHGGIDSPMLRSAWIWHELTALIQKTRLGMKDLHMRMDVFTPVSLRCLLAQRYTAIAEVLTTPLHELPLALLSHEHLASRVADDSFRAATYDETVQGASGPDTVLACGYILPSLAMRVAGKYLEILADPNTVFVVVAPVSGSGIEEVTAALRNGGTAHTAVLGEFADPDERMRLASVMNTGTSGNSEAADAASLTDYQRIMQGWRASFTKGREACVYFDPPDIDTYAGLRDMLTHNGWKAGDTSDEAKRHIITVLATRPIARVLLEYPDHVTRAALGSTDTDHLCAAMLGEGWDAAPRVGRAAMTRSGGYDGERTVATYESLFQWTEKRAARTNDHLYLTAGLKEAGATEVLALVQNTTGNVRADQELIDGIRPAQYTTNNPFLVALAAVKPGVQDLLWLNTPYRDALVDAAEEAMLERSPSPVQSGHEPVPEGEAAPASPAKPRLQRSAVSSDEEELLPSPPVLMSVTTAPSEPDSEEPKPKKHKKRKKHKKHKRKHHSRDHHDGPDTKRAHTE